MVRTAVVNTVVIWQLLNVNHSLHELQRLRLAMAAARPSYIHPPCMEHHATVPQLTMLCDVCSAATPPTRNLIMTVYGDDVERPPGGDER